MSLHIQPPPALTGSGEAQLRQLYGYLFRLSEQLNVAMDTMDGGGAAPVAYGGTSPLGEGTEGASTKDVLHALIVNTAEIIRREMDELQTVLHGEYTALSQKWGLYQAQMENTVTATAEGILQQYGFAADIEALEAQAAGFSRYRVRTEGYIRQGFIDRDSAGVPVIGIAIGQGLTGTETVVDGVTLLELDPTQSCAFYTPERVSFRINGQEVAYLSNRRLYIAHAQITRRLTLGRWLIEDTDGLTVKYIG